MYEFAANKMKLQRAIVTAGKDATEEQVKEAYVKIGGLVVAQPVNNVVENPVVEDAPVEKKSKKKK